MNQQSGIPMTRAQWGGWIGVGVVICGVVGTAMFLGGYSLAARRYTASPPAETEVTATPTIAAPLTPEPAPTADSPYRPVFVPSVCAFAIPPSAQVECGFVEVPEDRQGVLTDTIRLAIVLYHSPNPQRRPEPLVYLHGGPGGEAVQWSASVYTSFVAPFLQEQDVIVFDQRGAGLSEPALDCPEFTAAYGQVLTMAPLPAAQEELYAEALTACRERLVRQGVEPAAYVSSASAADVHDILTALGYKQADLYGLSYGTRLAQTIMRDYPTEVRSAVLDSVVPLDVGLYTVGTAAGDGALRALFTSCAADQKCASLYSGLAAEFSALVERLAAEPLVVTATLPGDRRPYAVAVDGERFTAALLWSMRYSEVIPLLPRMIAQTNGGHPLWLDELLSLPPQFLNRLGLGALLSAGCHEQVYALTPAEIDRVLAAYPALAALGLAEFFDSGPVLHAMCGRWQAAPANPAEKMPLVSNIPTLIIAGTYDSATPPVFARAVAALLSRVYFFEFPAGHVPSVDGRTDCPLRIAQEFLRNPVAEPRHGCLAEMGALHFVLPYSGTPPVAMEPFTDAEMDISGQAPKGWTAVGYGFYRRKAYIWDATQIGMQGSRLKAADWLAYLVENFNGRAGFEAPPELAGTWVGNGLTWGFYTAVSAGRPVNLALASAGSQTLLVIMLSERDEQAALYTDVFLPAVEALQPTP